MTTDPIICYCFGLTRDAVRAHFANESARIEDLIVRTGITTKCTACALDLDVLLDDIQRAASRPSLRAASLGTPARGWHRAVERADSGFFFNNGAVKSRLRLANYSAIDSDGSRCVPHRYRLTLFSNDGRVRSRLDGRIGSEAECMIDLASIANCPAEGWFLLRQTPERSGCYGTLRPQVVLEGESWVACYHTQFHRDATTSGRRASTPLRSVGGWTRALISIINGSPSPTPYLAWLTGPGLERVTKGRVAGNGHVLLDVDTEFPELPDNASLTLRVESRRPTKKNLINLHPDGGLGVDHFPNMV